ncbi:MAG: stage II sporulation protein R [Firmicutes bacterium]|nr:stage II sporulation protein R [Bacillota bacterium]
MKIVMISVLAIGAIALVVFAGLGFASPNVSAQGNTDFLRIHIRANSNSQEDQNVKYVVRQNIVDNLTPIFYNVNSRKDAMNRLQENLTLIEQISNDTLERAGFTYSAAAKIRTEHFPPRTYFTRDANMTLPEGIYDALIIYLGEATGDNWWSVIYPPLCFLDNEIGGVDGIRFRLRILEILRARN